MLPIISGRTAAFVLLLAVCVMILVGIYLSRKKLVSFKIRKLPALDAMKEAVGRAVEMGRPVHFTASYMPLSGAEAAMNLSALTLLTFLARLCARYKATLLVSVGTEQTLPLQIENVRQAYQAEGHPEDFKLENIRYLSGEQMAFSAGVIQTLVGERVAANIMVGAFAGEAALLAETGSRAGAIQIAGTPRAVQMPYMAVVCDFCLYGEELYAAGAYLSDDAEMKGSLAGQDWGKILGLGITIVGAILLTFLGDRTIPQLLSR
jgi:hypothetical protein